MKGNAQTDIKGNNLLVPLKENKMFSHMLFQKYDCEKENFMRGSSL